MSKKVCLLFTDGLFQVERQSYYANRCRNRFKSANIGQPRRGNILDRRGSESEMMAREIVIFMASSGYGEP